MTTAAHPNPAVAHARDFASWDELVDYSEGGPSRAELDPSFYGVERPAEAYRLARNGWPEGMDAVRPLVVAALNCATESAPDLAWSWDVTGADYDVGEYLSGAPECWLTRDPSTARPVITLAVSNSASASIAPAVIRARGAAVVALVLALQQAGHAVRLFVVDGSPVDSHSGAGTYYRALLSDDAGGPLDVDRVVFALSHPASLRVIGFAASRRQAGAGTDSMLGLPYDPPEALGWTSDLYVGRAMHGEAQWLSPEAAGAWVVEHFHRLTGQGASAA